MLNRVQLGSQDRLTFTDNWFLSSAAAGDNSYRIQCSFDCVVPSCLCYAYPSTMQTTWSDLVTLNVPCNDCHRKLYPYQINHCPAWYPQDRMDYMYPIRNHSFDRYRGASSSVRPMITCWPPCPHEGSKIDDPCWFMNSWIYSFMQIHLIILIAETLLLNMVMPINRWAKKVTKLHTLRTLGWLSFITLWGLGTWNVTSPRNWALFGDFLFFY